jgi:hypothetical protein
VSHSPSEDEPPFRFLGVFGPPRQILRNLRVLHDIAPFFDGIKA